MNTPEEQEPTRPSRPVVTDKAEAEQQALVVAMRRELNNNQHKGHWDDWTPSAQTLHMDFAHHLRKLEAALDAKDPARVTEHCGDLANLLSKALALYGSK